MVVIFPTEDLSSLDLSFGELVCDQIHRCAIHSVWMLDYEVSCALAAFRCALEFGSFNPQVHKPKFL